MDTTSLGFQKPKEEEYYDINIFNKNTQLANDLIEKNSSAIGQIATRSFTQKGVINDNLDNITEPGNYLCSSTCTNIPLPYNGNLKVFRPIPDNFNHITHIIDMFNGTNYLGTFIRNKFNGTWTSWDCLGFAKIPTETIITTGFASGWSGSLRYRKNQEGYVTLKGTLKKNVDIGTGVETIYTLPSGFRPIGLNERITVNGYNEFSVSIPNSFLNLATTNDGRLMVYPVVSTNLVGVKQLYDFSFSYYGS